MQFALKPFEMSLEPCPNGCYKDDDSIDTASRELAYDLKVLSQHSFQQLVLGNEIRKTMERILPLFFESTVRRISCITFVAFSYFACP